MASIHHIEIRFTITCNDNVPEAYDVVLEDHGNEGWKLYHDGQLLHEDMCDMATAVHFANLVAEDLAKDYN